MRTEEKKQEEVLPPLPGKIEEEILPPLPDELNQAPEVPLPEAGMLKSIDTATTDWLKKLTPRA